MLEEVGKFSDWLSLTPVSMLFQTVEWVIPMVQSVHILAIAIVMSSVIMVDLRLMGLMGHSQSISGLTRRFIPWVWWSLVVLLLTGLVLITAEPRRDLLNPVFQVKMVLVVAAIVVTAIFQETVRRNMEFWDLNPSRRMGAWATAVISLLLWSAIVGCGRWIAYVEHG
jgi:uncharacterized membrane protein SirB2